MTEAKKKTASFQEPDESESGRTKSSDDAELATSGDNGKKLENLEKYNANNSSADPPDDDDETIKSNNSSIRPPLLRKDTFSMKAAKSLSFRAAKGTQLEGNEYDDDGWLVYTRTTGDIKNKARVQKVRIEASVTFIPDKTFYGCANLTTLELPKDEDSRLVSIGQFAFYECESLRICQLPNSIKDIGEYAFSGCSQLTTIQLPDNLSAVEEGVFSDCPQLTTVFVPKSIAKIGLYAFYGCNNLCSILLPDTVESIGEEALEGCDLINNLCDKSMTLKEWLRHRYNRFPLHRLCYLPGHTDLEVLVFKKHIDTIDEAKQNPLHILCLNPYANLDVSATLDMLRALVSNSTNKTALVSTQDVQGRTPMHYACLNPFVNLAMMEAMVESIPGRSFLGITDKNHKSPTAIAVDCSRPKEIQQWLYRCQPVEARELARDSVAADLVVQELASNYISDLTENKERDIGTSFPPEEQHGWVRFASQLYDVELSQKLAGYIGRAERNVVKALANAQDYHGRRAIHCAVSGIKEALQVALLFCGRHDLEDQPRYKDGTGVVVFGTDVKGKGGPQGTKVALKFVSDKDSFERELGNRFEDIERIESQRFDDQYVAKITATHNGANDKDVEMEAKKSELPLHCMVMEQFDRNLSEAILLENISSNMSLARSALFDLVRSLRHMHEKGFVHCGVRPKSVVRFRTKNNKTHWKLINIDCCSNIGAPTNPALICSAFMPPEMVRMEKNKEASVLEIAVQPSLDVWSFGVILFMLESRKLHLLPEYADTNDDLDKAGMRKLASWDSSDVKERLASLPPGLAKDLLTKVLNKRPEKRPSADDIFQDDFFASERRLLELEKMLDAARSVGNEATVHEIQQEIENYQNGWGDMSTKLNQTQMQIEEPQPEEKPGFFRDFCRVVVGGKKSQRQSSGDLQRSLTGSQPTYSSTQPSTTPTDQKKEVPSTRRRQRRASMGEVVYTSGMDWATTGSGTSRRTSMGAGTSPSPTSELNASNSSSNGRKQNTTQDQVDVANCLPSKSDHVVLAASVTNSPSVKRWGRRRRRNSIF